MKLRTALAAASVLGLAAGPLLATIAADAGPVAVSKITVLTDDSFVDADQEAVNLIDDLEAGGHSVTTIDDVSNEEDFLAKLGAAEVFVIPELEHNDDGDIAPASLPDDFTDAEAEAIQDFVDGGGRILFFGSSDPTGVINALFGFEVAWGDADWCGTDVETKAAAPSNVSPAASDGDCELTAEAADTELADGPTPLTAVNDTTSLAPGSLPEGSTTFYGGTFTTDGVTPTAATTVAGAVSMPYGDGVVVFLGWDWYPDSDNVESGSVSAASVEDEADWAEVLDLAVSQPKVTASVGDDGKVTFTSDSPSTQPVFVSFVVNGQETIVTIEPKTTSTTIAGPTGEVTSASFTVPGWGIGEGDVAVEGTSAEAPTPAAPVPAQVPFTG